MRGRSLDCLLGIYAHRAAGTEVVAARHKLWDSLPRAIYRVWGILMLFQGKEEVGRCTYMCTSFDPLFPTRPTCVTF